MTQQVEYPAIPNTAPPDYQSVVKQLLAYVKRESPTDKDLRRHMRARSIYDKATAPALLDLIGIEVSESACTLNPLGQELYDLDDDGEWKKALFKSLGGRNPILLKYVFDALAERLYSVNEMYRVLTSYVYPGEHVTLVHFKNWMGWIEASGMIKYIGIRWGPSPLLKEMEEYLRTIDIEEFLEEEAEGAEYDEEDEEAEAGEAGEADAEAGPAEGVDALEEPELPPEPPLPDVTGGRSAAAAAVAAPAAAVHAAASAAHARPAPVHPAVPVAAAAEPPPSMPPYQVRLTLQSVAEIQEVQRILELDPGGSDIAERGAALDDAELAFNLRRLREMWVTAQDQSLLGFDRFALDPNDYRTRSRKKGLKPFFVYRGLVAATCAFRPIRVGGSSRDPARDPVDRFRVLEESGALTRHFVEGQPIDEVITALVASGHSARLDVLGLAPYLVLARQALANGDDWLKELEKATAADALWESVYSRLHAGVFTLELVWLVREMARNGLWAGEGMEATGVVPTQEVMDIAFRIGLMPTPYLADFASTLYASRTLTGFCGKEYGYEAGLAYFGRQMGCAYGCPNRVTCGYFCREKLRR